MPSLTETRLRILSRNRFFRQHLINQRVQLGLPWEGVPSQLADQCGLWLERRGPHPSGGSWPLSEYQQRAANLSGWFDELVRLPQTAADYEVKSWLRGVVPAYGVPKQIAPAIRKFLIDDALDAFKKSCAELQVPEIKMDWKIDTGNLLYIEGIDSNISREDWDKLYNRVQPQLARQQNNTLDAKSMPARKRDNLERDLYIFEARDDGMSFEDVATRWTDEHPNDAIDATAVRRAFDDMLELMMPDRNWIVEITSDGNIVPGDWDGARKRIKQRMTEKSKRKRAYNKSRG